MKTYLKFGIDEENTEYLYDYSFTSFEYNRRIVEKDSVVTINITSK